MKFRILLCAIDCVLLFSALLIKFGHVEFGGINVDGYWLTIYRIWYLAFLCTLNWFNNGAFKRAWKYKIFTKSFNEWHNDKKFILTDVYLKDLC